MFLETKQCRSIIKKKFIGSEAGTLASLEIPGCNEDERCILKRGTNATVEIDFAISE